MVLKSQVIHCFMVVSFCQIILTMIRTTKNLCAVYSMQYWARTVFFGPGNVRSSMIQLKPTLVVVSFGATVVVFFLTLTLFPERIDAKMSAASPASKSVTSSSSAGLARPVTGRNWGGGLSVVVEPASSTTIVFKVVFGLKRPNSEPVRFVGLVLENSLSSASTEP